MSSTTSAISLENIFVEWKGTPVLRGLNLQVAPGESFGVIGPSGAGKTVLLKLISGLVVATLGTRSIFGDSAKFSKRMSMTFQRSGLFDSFTAKENLLFAMREWNVPANEIEGRADEVLEDVGLKGQGDLFPHEMSGGMQKRLGIARALSLKTEIVLYDDPTAGLDPVTSRTIVELILEMKKKYGMTLVIVSSDIKVAFALSERMGFLYRGDFASIDSVDGIRQSENASVRQFVHGLLQGPLNEVNRD